VTGLLEDHFANIVDTTFTARMEESLDTVESGEEDWVGILDAFYPDFHKLIEQASTIDRSRSPTSRSERNVRNATRATW
jgi:DNA topoisomerase IA